MYEPVNDVLLSQWRYNKKKGLTNTVPPQMPDGVSLYSCIRTDGKVSGWQEFTKATTMGVEAPEDPILTEHNEFWKGIFEELRIPNPTEIKNQYCGSKLEPWYEFEINGTKWVMGPRKRVNVIEVRSPTPILFTAIRALATRDKVTQYEEEVNSFGVHAWDRKALIEYFYALMSAVSTRS